jgi:hypothetical protein
VEKRGTRLEGFVDLRKSNISGGQNEVLLWSPEGSMVIVGGLVVLHISFVARCPPSG